jgi:hypothetical protein
VGTSFYRKDRRRLRFQNSGEDAGLQVLLPSVVVDKWVAEASPGLGWFESPEEYDLMMFASQSSGFEEPDNMIMRMSTPTEQIVLQHTRYCPSNLASRL